MRQLFLSCLLLLSWSAMAQDNSQHAKDSLRSVISHSEGEEKTEAYKALSYIYINEAMYDEQKRDTLFAFFDEMTAEARRQGNEKMVASTMNVRLNNLYNFRQYDEVIRLTRYYLKVMEKVESWTSFYSAYMKLAGAYRLTGREKEALATGQEMYQHAKEKAHNFGMAMAFFEMSKFYSFKRRFTEEEKCLRDCINLLSDSLAYSAHLIDACRNLCSCLISQKRYADALSTTDELENAIKRCEEFSKRSQPAAWRQFYSICLDVYRQSNDWVNAEVYCNKIDSLTDGKANTFEAKAFIALSKKRYAEALEMIDKAIEVAPPHNIIMPRASKISIWLQASGLKDANQTDSLYREVLDMLETIHDEQMTVQLDELRTQYEVEKMQYEMALAQAGKKQFRDYMLFALGGCLLLAVILGIYVYYYRLIKKKNIALFRQIKEQEQRAQLQPLFEVSMPTVLKDTAETSEMQPDTFPPNKKQRRQLVARFHEYLKKDNNYANPDINIDDIIPTLATNRAYFFEAVKDITNKTPMEYIRTMQLEASQKMLEKNFELSIEAIAVDCGFNSRNTFYRLFRDQYQMSPKEYRSIAKKVL